VLGAILERKRREVEELRLRASALERAAEEAGPVRDFRAALRRPDVVAVIAEFKRRSPSAGPIREDAGVGPVVAGYARAGAAAVSVLTDAAFGGSLDDLREARARVGVPLLRKDFVLDPVQVAEARAAGADAVLFVVRALDPAALRACAAAAESWGLAALFEVHDEAELDRALEAGAAMVGINNRDLATFRTDLRVTERLVVRVPAGILVVSESGFRGPEDVRWAGALGVDAVLVGESLMAAPDPGGALAGWVGQPRRSRG
jgi:indole-3-glycerol phosphate synthase